MDSESIIWDKFQSKIDNLEGYLIDIQDNRKPSPDVFDYIEEDIKDLRTWVLGFLVGVQVSDGKW